jgi:hypothetical protein
MEKLTDFKPLERVELPELGEIDCSGLILVVGPNSSGKTQLLRDLYRRLKGDPGGLVVARHIGLRKLGELEPFLACLEREGYLERFTDDGNNKQVRLKATFVGTGEAPPGLIRAHDLESWYQSFSNDAAPLSHQQPWLSSLGRCVVTALFLDRRLTAANQVGLIDFESQPPQQDLHALHLNDSAKQELLCEMRNTFSRTVWPDASKGNALSIRVSNSPDLPTSEDRLSPTKMLKYRTVESEGDGLKSYVASCIALLLGRRPVCLMDEPELCLHPPQAYNLGRFIGKFGSSPDIVTFVATHSSHVLRGVIDAAPTKLQIVRLVRRGEGFAAHLVQSTVLTEALKKPAVRAESVLDGVFAQAVVVLEADTDRIVYQATFGSVREETRLDIHFSSGEGSSAIASKSRLYRTLKIPVAVIADLDVLVDHHRLKQVLTSLVEESSVVSQLAERAKEIEAKIKALSPEITPANVQERLKEGLSGTMNWSQCDDVNVRRELNRIANELDRMKRLKRGGIEALPDGIKEPADQLVRDLAQHGLFLVPVGELEQWLPDSQVSVSKERKPEWANAAAAYIRSVEPQNDGIWKFIRGVASFLNL